MIDQDRMIHLDLFSGIGGFALAVDEVFPGTEHIFCEIDPYCQALLKRRFPGATIFGDIRTLANSNSGRSQEQEQQTTGHKQCDRKFTADTSCGKSGEQTEQEGREDFGRSRCDILTGGFPCQPFSQAGKRRGTEDNRYLWPEMLRVIHEFRPSWVIAENVRGLLTIEQGVVFQQVCTDLEGEGYEVQPLIIPAVAVNAPHRRDRVWFVGYSGSSRLSGDDRRGSGKEFADRHTQYSHAPDTESKRGQQHRDTRSGWHGLPDNSWNQNWLEVATELCGVDDGLPAELDFAGFTKARHRVERLKALGNAIVPQVAVEILKAIKAAEMRRLEIQTLADSL